MAAKERADADAGISAGAVFDALYEHAPTGIALFSIGGKCLRANAALCRLLRDSEEELLQKTHRDVEQLDSDTDIVIGKARWELPGLAALPEMAWDQHRAKLTRHESFSDFVFLRYNKAGELRYLSVSGEPLFDEKGAFRGYHGVGKDITERARDQKALEESERRYRTLFDANPYPMWVVDAKTLAFLAVNDAAISLYGY